MRKTISFLRNSIYLAAYIFVAYFLLISCTPMAPVGSPILFDNREPGCYEDQVVPDKWTTRNDTFYRYTGADMIGNNEIESLTITTKPKRKEWEKRYQNQVGSRDGNEMLCLVEKPAEEISLTVVKDTSVTKDFEEHIVDIKIRMEENGYSKSVKVVCDHDIDHNLILAIQQKLILKKYLEKPESGSWDKSTRQALFKFHKENNLPLSARISHETLKILEINYDF